MSIDDRLRAGLPAALDALRPDLDADLTVLLDRAARRSRIRITAYAVGLVAAALTTALTLRLGGGESRGSVDPAAPGGEVRVLDAGRGSPGHPVPLDPGRYAVPFIGGTDSAPWAEVEVPAGWGQDRLLLATGPDADPQLRRVELLAVDRVAPDPCDGTTIPVKGRVADIVAALTDQSTVQPTGARRVSIDGYSGQLVRFRVPLEVDVKKCWDGKSLKPFGLGGSWTTVFPGWTYRLWVLNVERQPLVIMAAHGPETTPTENHELTDIVKGITFVAPHE